MTHTICTSDRFALSPVHDARHKLRADAMARESLVFMLQLPEHDIAAFVYTWVSGESKAGAAFCVYGPAIGKEPLFEAVDGIAVPFEMGFDDWRVGGAHVRHGKALEVADLSYVGKSARLDYHFEAMHPAYNYGAQIGGCPTWLADDRFEQSGRVTGVLTIGDRKIPFDTFGHRDHSWGTRDWGAAQHWKWLESQAHCPKRGDLSVHFFDIEAGGRNVLRGYVQKDGRIEEVTSVRVNYSNDADWYHTTIEAIVEDAGGRTTVVRGKTFAMYEFKVSPLATLNEGSMSVEIDGVAGVGHVEMCWPKSYLDHLRQTSAPQG
ncbi:MAG TPA: hypothetical protein VFY31_00930 [Macromonas sp.]|nr:hypothetical protein [Macromonas sp.]